MGKFLQEITFLRGTKRERIFSEISFFDRGTCEGSREKVFMATFLQREALRGEPRILFCWWEFSPRDALPGGGEGGGQPWSYKHVRLWQWLMFPQERHSRKKGDGFWSQDT